ncbi:MAG TPA: 30S ribosomal protein S4 [Candidatus Paceibacterota bacterium]|nr:30S ribosomal protein S4 [Candidatus Paceibacterota bacterium]
MLRGPKYKVCRRVGGMVFPQCQSPRYTSTLTKEGARGGRKGRPKPKSEYGTQFQEKQKAKFTYGVTERQFVNYVNASKSSKKGNPANMLCQALETRLDNVIFRLGFASSRAFARQMVSHGHILVNGKRLNTPSYGVKLGDKISVRQSSQKSPLFAELKSKLKDFKFPKWLKFDLDKSVAEVIYLPELADGDQTLNLNVVMEFYSRT